ncbi:unnamed protein product [Vicia faba]|uniref:Uncharacterized protein n=1 Tax=Vicia faba TaxID=3906 RepID=A0AAV0ZU73_VICFA|nr:unnamed protein product [Vicia faba]
MTFITSVFGNAYSFEILKTLGGLTVKPVQSASIWKISDILLTLLLMIQYLKSWIRLTTSRKKFIKSGNNLSFTTETQPYVKNQKANSRNRENKKSRNNENNTLAQQQNKGSKQKTSPVIRK